MKSDNFEFHDEDLTDEEMQEFIAALSENMENMNDDELSSLQELIDEDEDEEVEEDMEMYEIDPILKNIAYMTRLLESQPSIINFARVKELLDTYKLLQQLKTDCPDLVITYSIHKPYASFGHITIKGVELVFKRSDIFLEAMKHANNFDVTVMVDDTIELNFGFNDLARIITPKGNII